MPLPPPPLGLPGQSILEQQKARLEEAQDAASTRDWIVGVLAASAVAAFVIFRYGRPCLETKCMGARYCSCLEYGDWSVLRVAMFIALSLAIVAPGLRTIIRTRRRQSFWVG